MLLKVDRDVLVSRRYRWRRSVVAQRLVVNSVLRIGVAPVEQSLVTLHASVQRRQR